MSEDKNPNTTGVMQLATGARGAAGSAEGEAPKPLADLLKAGDKYSST